MLKNKILTLSIIVLVISVFGRLFASAAPVANDLHFTFKEEAEEFLSLPSTWGAKGAVGLGEYAVFVLWNWPLQFISGLFYRLDLTYPLVIKIVGILPFLFLAFWGINRLLAQFKVGKWGKLVASFFFLANTYILLLIDGGQLNLALAYGTLPLVFSFWLSAIEKPTLSTIAKLVLASFALSVFDIRIIYLFLILVLLHFVFIPKFLVNNLLVGFSLIFFLSLLHGYWILPSVLVRSPSLPTGFERLSQVDFLSFAQLKHSISLLQPHWHENVFGKVAPFRKEFLVIPILVFLGPFLKLQDKKVWFWVTVALVSAFLVKGSNPPLSEVYPWLFIHLPGFSLFRDPTKFFFLTALSYSVLLGITVERVSKNLHLNNLPYLSKIRKFLPLLIVFYLLWLIRPVYLGQMTGTFSKSAYQEEYFSLAQRLQQDEEFGRVFWIPTKQPLGYSSPTHPSVEAARLVQKRPFAIGTVGTYETFNFLREAPFTGELFNIAGIKYLVYPFPDTRREELKQDNIDYYNAFLSQLSGLDWAEPISTNSAVPLLKTREHQDRFFVPRNTVFVVGSDDIYEEINDLSENAIVFTEEQPGLLSKIEDFPNAKILLNGKNKTDLAVGLLSSDRFVFPARVLDFSPVNFGWWKRETPDFISWRAFLQQKYSLDNQDFDYGGGWAVAEEDAEELVLSSIQGKEGDVLLARVMESPRGGLIEFFQEGELVGRIESRKKDAEKVETKLTGYAELPDQIFEYDKAEFHWHEAGQVKSPKDLVIRGTEGEINVVNALAVLPKEKWEEIKRGIESLQEKNITLSGLRGEEGNVTVSYKRLSPTHYIVSVSGLSGPATLAFSENYDGLWETGGQSSVPFYSLINGFPIEGDGEYEVIFTAQRYVLPGIKITLLTLAFILGALIFSRVRA